MSTSMLLWVTVLCGAGTFLFRFLPMLWQAKGRDKGWGQGRTRRALDAVGPSAIVALLVVSFTGLVDAQEWVGTGTPLLAGVLGVFVGKRLFGTIAAATLTGVLAYGLALWALS